MSKLWWVCLWLIFDGHFCAINKAVTPKELMQLSASAGIVVQTPICSNPPNIANGAYNGTFGNFPNNTWLDSVSCYSGYSPNSDPNVIRCICPSPGGTCSDLTAACVEDIVADAFADEYRWLTIRGDPDFDADGQSGIWSLSTLVGVANIMGWISISMYLGLLIVDTSHFRAPLVGIQALLWQFLYAGLVASFGPRMLPDGSCAVRRKIFNFLIGAALGVVISFVEWRKARKIMAIAATNVESFTNPTLKSDTPQVDSLTEPPPSSEEDELDETPKPQDQKQVKDASEMRHFGKPKTLREAQRTMMQVGQMGSRSSFSLAFFMIAALGLIAAMGSKTASCTS